MKEIKIENTTVVVDTENKDIELYAIVQAEENTWHIVNENGEVVDIITKDDIINYCKSELEDNRTECLSPDIMIDCVWFNVLDDYNLDYVDNYCQDWDKFIAWFDYVVVEYLAQEIVAIYKQRLLNCE